MRRSVKVAALASAATLLAIGASMTSFAAARGWTQEDGEWVWLDSNGERVTATFKQSGSNYYYLNDDGYLASDELVEYEDNYYYVDETGAMVKNQWKELENNDDDDDFEDTVWYYFQSTGKAYKNGKKSINGTSYIFNEDGKMLFGWIRDDGNSTYSMGSKDEDNEDWKDCVYYAGEANDGAVVTSAWRQIRVYEGSTPSLKNSDADTGDYDYWFYFGSNGKKYRATSEKDIAKGYVEKTIKSVKYAFAEDGHMASEWVDEASAASEGAKYFKDPESGARVSKGWFKAVPSEGVDEENSEKNDNSAQWFYANNNGELVKAQVKTINSKKYLFNKYGECKAGLYYLWFDEDGKTIIDMYKLNSDSRTEDDLNRYTTDLMVDTAIDSDNDDDTTTSEKNGIYYFATPLDTDAAMKTGTATIEIDGDSYAFKFKTSGATKGRGINGVDNSSYYVNGRKLKADSDEKFVMYQIYNYNADSFTFKKMELVGEKLTANDIVRDGDESVAYAVISSSGIITKSGTKKDGDDYKLTVKNYVLQKIKNSDAKSTDAADWEYDAKAAD